jgi:hypothetical protein
MVADDRAGVLQVEQQQPGDDGVERLGVGEGPRVPLDEPHRVEPACHSSALRHGEQRL